MIKRKNTIDSPALMCVVGVDILVAIIATGVNIFTRDFSSGILNVINHLTVGMMWLSEIVLFLAIIVFVFKPRHH